MYFIICFDLSGRLLACHKITGKEVSVDMNNLSPATYLLKVIRHTQESSGEIKPNALKTLRTLRVVKR